MASPERAFFPTEDHDHDACVVQAIDRAVALCAARGARLTPIRRRVLEIVWRGHAPVGAYAILDAMRAEGRDAKPPTVYRALDFLLAQGLIHRIERLNAYVGCVNPGDDHFGQFLLCRDCGALAELDDPSISSVVTRRAGLRGFAVERVIVEVEGLCPACLARRGLPPVQVR